MRKLAGLAIALAAVVVPFVVAPAANAATAHQVIRLGPDAISWAAADGLDTYQDNTFELDNGPYKVVFANTYLTITENGSVLYQGGPGNWLELASNGDMDLLSASGYTFWDNGVNAGYPYYGLDMQDNGDLVEWGNSSPTDFSHATAIWQSDTFGS